MNRMRKLAKELNMSIHDEDWFRSRWVDFFIELSWEHEDEVWERTILAYNARNLQQDINDGKSS